VPDPEPAVEAPEPETPEAAEARLRAEIAHQAQVFGRSVPQRVARIVAALGKPYEEFTAEELERTAAQMREQTATKERT
jgi:hypothetical protein